jgi:hypothetical protein
VIKIEAARNHRNERREGRVNAIGKRKIRYGHKTQKK